MRDSERQTHLTHWINPTVFNIVALKVQEEPLLRLQGATRKKISLDGDDRKEKKETGVGVAIRVREVVTETGWKVYMGLTSCLSY